MDQNWTNQNGIFQLSVAYHLEGLTPETRSHSQGGVQIYPKGKFTIQNQEKKVMLPPHQFLSNSHIG